MISSRRRRRVRPRTSNRNVNGNNGKKVWRDHVQEDGDSKVPETMIWWYDESKKANQYKSSNGDSGTDSSWNGNDDEENKWKEEENNKKKRLEEFFRMTAKRRCIGDTIAVSYVLDRNSVNDDRDIPPLHTICINNQQQQGDEVQQTEM